MPVRRYEGGLICIDHIRVFARDDLHHLVENRRREYVIVIQDREIITCRHFESGIGIPGDTEILLELFIVDILILPDVLFTNGPDRFLTVCAPVGNTEFPAGIGLSDDGVQHIP